MPKIHNPLALLSTASFLAFSLFLPCATLQAQQSCSVTLTLRNPTASSIFTVQQERALGDIEAEWIETNYHPIHNDEFASHLNAIAARVLSQFPTDHPPVRVILIDTPEADSFSVGPERIYISRKMVALLKNDHELAGLLGHELGHILTHQNAIIVSQLFHKILGVDSVTDRKDISDKLRRMLDAIDRDVKLLRKASQVIQMQEAMHQNDADRVALYAAAAAGFSPQAFPELFGRSAGTTESSASVLTDFFGSTTSNLRRLREIKKNLKQLPRSCQEIVPATSPEFLTWHAAVMSPLDLAGR